MSSLNGFGDLLASLQEKYATVLLGGGQKNIERHHLKGKLTARERIQFLLDSGTDYVEIGTFAGEGMYEEYGGCPSGGIVVVVGYVSKRLCVVAANDATVKSGAWFPITGKKSLRAQEIALENRLPIIYLVDSAGVFLPLQAEVFPDKEHFGRQFYHNTQLALAGVPQLAAVMGSCVAGGAYLPAMSDESFIVKGTGSIFLGGSYLVKAAIGEDTDNETLGGAETHCTLSGVIDNQYPNDKACLLAIRSRMALLGKTPEAGYTREIPEDPLLPDKDIYQILPLDRAKPYDTHKLLDWLVDKGSWREYKKDYGKTLLCGYAKIVGWSFGIVANQRMMCKSGTGEAQMGGVIYSDSSNKAARFVMNCNQRRIPLLFLQDVSGFMVGSRAEKGGIIKDGAKLVSAISSSVVPKFTFLIGNSYGAGNYAMCGRAYNPRLMMAWPTARLGVMSGKAASDTLWQIKKHNEKNLSTNEEEKLKQDIETTYENALSPYYAAARLWVDGVVPPTETRKILNLGMLMAQHSPPAAFRLGPIQT